MNIWEMFDGIGERRTALRVAKLSLPPQPRYLTHQLLIALLLIGMFAWAFERNSDKDARNLMMGALIAAFAGAWGYFLGSSNTAARANDRTDAALMLTHDAVKALPAPEKADVTLKPGETAVAEGERAGRGSGAQE